MSKSDLWLIALTFTTRKWTITTMAKTLTVTDDLDGSANAQTVTFSLNGKGFEIDLSKKNAASLEKILKPYIDAARPAAASGRRSGSTGPGRGRGKRATPAVDLASVRAWANEAGIQVSDRGRISGAVLEQYAAAH
jgi:Lsr2